MWKQVLITVLLGAAGCLESPGTESGSGARDAPIRELGFAINPHPGDPHLATLSLEDGTRIDYFGSRDDAGMPSGIARLRAETAEGLVVNSAFDSSGRPVEIRSNDGSALRFEWVSAVVARVRGQAPDGTPQGDVYFNFATGEPVDEESARGLGSRSLAATSSFCDVPEGKSLLVRINVNDSQGTPDRSLAGLVEQCEVHYGFGGLVYPCCLDEQGWYVRIPDPDTLPEILTGGFAEPCTKFVEALSAFCSGSGIGGAALERAILAFCLTEGIYYAPQCVGALNVVWFAGCVTASLVDGTDFCQTWETSSADFYEGPVRLRAFVDIRSCDGALQTLESGQKIVTGSTISTVLDVDASVADSKPNVFGFASLGETTVTISDEGSDIRVYQDTGLPLISSAAPGERVWIPSLLNETVDCHWPSRTNPIETVVRKNDGFADTTVDKTGGSFHLRHSVRRDKHIERSGTAEEIEALRNGANSSCVNWTTANEKHEMITTYSVPLRPFQRLVVTLRREGVTDADTTTELTPMFPLELATSTGTRDSRRFEISYAQAKNALGVFGQPFEIEGVEIAGDNSFCIPVIFMITMSSEITLTGLDWKSSDCNWTWDIEITE